MPLLTDKYKALESELVPLVLGAINAEESYGTPNVFPQVKIYSDGIVIKCLESDKDLWVQKLNQFSELFEEKNTPIRAGNSQYVSAESYVEEGYCSIKINVSLIDLDRLLESESVLYQESGNVGALYKKANVRGLDGFLSVSVIEAINNTIFEKEGYPVAYLVKEKNNAFCLVCDSSDREYIKNAFYDFHLLFEDLCKKHNINLLPNSTQYVTSRALPDSTITKYEFNISPADMEQLLLLECSSYAGYRGAASINRLVDPDGADIKDGVLCLFPALLLSDGEYMPRQAGCNMSEIISVQLANYIKKHLLSDIDVPKEEFFGHHNSILTKDFLKIDQLDLFDALAKCMGVNGIFSHESEDGTRVLKKSDTPLIQICDLDNEDSIRIYQRYAVVTHNELQDLKSCEIPILDFMDKLLEAVEDKIKRLSEIEMDRASDYTRQGIENAKQAVLEINKLKAAIKGLSSKMRV